MPAKMHDHEVDVDVDLVRDLLGDQFPHLAGRPLRIVEPWGTDNAVWRLGDDLVVRLPRIEGATAQIGQDATWLPRLAPHVPVPTPEPVAIGAPGRGYPFVWAIHRWLPGQGAHLDTMADPDGFARDLADVVRHLHGAPPDGAPVARNRARPLAEYDAATRRAVASAAHLIDADAAIAVWEDALAAPPHHDAPVWVHADLEGNCLLDDAGHLAGLVDWGSACAGDPAVDVQVVWSPLFTERSRLVFLADLGLAPDDPVVRRSRGASIHQACAALPYYLDTYPLIVERSWHKLAQLGVHPIER